MLINIRKPCQQQLSFMLTTKTTCYWLKANVVTSVWNWRRLLKKVEKQNFQMLCWKDKSQGWLSKISERGDAFSFPPPEVIASPSVCSGHVYVGDEWRSYRKQHHGNSQRDGHQHGQTHAQNEDVVRAHAAVRVQQLRLHATFPQRDTQSESHGRLRAHSHTLENKITGSGHKWLVHSKNHDDRSGRPLTSGERTASYRKKWGNQRWPSAGTWRTWPRWRC